MSLLLLALLACRPSPDPTTSGPTPPQPTSATDDTDDTGPPTGDTAITTVLPTGDTTVAITGDTHATGATANTAATGTTAHTGVPAPPTDTCGRPIEADDTNDTGACGTFPATYPYDTAPPPLADTGIDCPGDTAAPPACPQLEWVLHLPGDTDVWIDDLSTFPNGDVLVLGSDERGVTFHEGEPNEFRVPEVCPGVPATPWLARIDGDGQLVWARRPVDGCSDILTQGLVMNAQGDAAAFGTFTTWTSDPITFGPGSANAFDSPPPDGHQDLWVAAFDEHGELLHGHVISAPEVDGDNVESILAIALADDGTLYASGQFRDRITLDPQQPWVTTLQGDPLPTYDPNAKVMWLAAWNADGSLRWARTDATGGRGAGIPAAIHPSDAGPTVLTLGANEVLWDACGEHETAQSMVVNGATPAAELRYDAASGATTAHRIIDWYPSFPHAVEGGFLLPETRYTTDEPLALGDDIVLPPVSHSLVYQTDTCSTYAWASTNRGSIAGSTMIHDADLRHGYAAIAGNGEGLPRETTFGCGETLPPGDGSQRWGWYLFTDQGEGLCGAAIPVPRSFSATDWGIGIAPDGLYFASSWVGRGRVAEGTPLAFELDSSDADVLLYRYRW